MKFITVLLLTCITNAALRYNSYIFPHFKSTSPYWRIIPYEDNIFREYTDQQILGLFTSSQPRTKMPHYSSASNSNFDSRLKWPNCITPIQNSGNCVAAVAVSTVDTFADRLCIYTNTSIMLSSQDMLSCDSSNFGCQGGFIYNAWNYLKNTGVTTNKCIPYSSYNGTCSACLIKCSNTDEKYIKYKCPNLVTVFYDKDTMMKLISTNGPLQSTMDVYRDFLYYGSGIYVSDYKSFLGMQSVRILGWGEQEGLMYWIVANNWGSKWGENGYFRIGMDECGVNNEMTGCLL